MMFALLFGVLATAEHPTGPSPRMSRDDMIGVWQSNLDPEGSVSITQCQEPGLAVRAGRRFEAFGYFENGKFFGVCHDLGALRTLSGGSEIVVIQVRAIDNRTLLAEFSNEFHQAPLWRETWKTATRSGESRWVTSAGDSLPLFGDFVQVEELPEAIVRVPPEYPIWAQQEGITGTVVLQALVERDGRVKDVRVVKSIPALDQYAVGCIKQWRFKPAMTKGAPVAVWVAVPIRFSLH